jgi:hypothetical protein
MWWSSSPLAAQMDPPAIAKLRRLWLIMAEQEYVHDQLYNVIGWDNIALYARSPDGPDWQRVQELFDRDHGHFDKWRGQQGPALARARRQAPSTERA